VKKKKPSWLLRASTTTGLLLLVGSVCVDFNALSSAYGGGGSGGHAGRAGSSGAAHGGSSAFGGSNPDGAAVYLDLDLGAHGLLPKGAA